jgi:hypothetical protein
MQFAISRKENFNSQLFPLSSPAAVEDRRLLVEDFDALERGQIANDRFICLLFA